MTKERTMDQLVPPPAQDPIYLCILEDLFASASSDLSGLAEKAFEFAPEAIIVLNKSNNIVLANSNVSEIYKIDFPYGKKCWEVIR